MRHLLFLLTLAFLMASSVRAQSPPSPTPGALQPRVEVGVGLSAASDFSTVPGISARAGLYLIRNRSMLVVRSTINPGSSSRDDIGFGSMFATTHGEVAALLGRAVRNRSGFSAVAAGPALSWSAEVVGDGSACGFDCETRTERSGPYLGLAAEWGYHGALYRTLGYSLVLHGNLNTGSPFAGLTLGLAFGR